MQDKMAEGNIHVAVTPYFDARTNQRDKVTELAYSNFYLHSFSLFHKHFLLVPQRALSEFYQEDNSET